MPENKLYKLLLNNPSAPTSGFDKFIVGQAGNHAALLRARLNNLLQGDQPSFGCLVLGRNGNGKTLLNNILRRAATEINLRELRENDGRAQFTVLFSRVSLSHVGTESVGIELARNLTRSVNEPSHLTYTTIAAETLRHFHATYSPPMYLQLFQALPKVLLRRALEEYDKYIRDFLKGEIENLLDKGVEQAFHVIQKRLNRLALVDGFEEYADGRDLSSFLKVYVTTTGRSIEKMNKHLLNDLRASFSHSLPQDIIRTLSSFGSAVGSKGLILQIDDCNNEDSLNFLVQLAEHLGSFEHPRVMIMASAVEEVWNQNLEAWGDDLSAQQKVDEYFYKLKVAEPMEEDLIDLVNRLQDLVANEVAEDGRVFGWSRAKKQSLVSRCSGLTYRGATRLILQAAEKEMHH